MIFIPLFVCGIRADGVHAAQEFVQQVKQALQAVDESQGGAAALQGLTACIQAQRTCMQRLICLEDQQGLTDDMVNFVEDIRCCHLQWSSHTITRQHALALVSQQVCSERLQVRRACAAECVFVCIAMVSILICVARTCACMNLARSCIGSRDGGGDQAESQHDCIVQISAYLAPGCLHLIMLLNLSVANLPVHHCALSRAHGIQLLTYKNVVFT